MANKLTVRERIMNLLNKDLVLDAKSIAKRTKSNYNSVRRELGYLQHNFLVYSSKHALAKTRDYYTL